MHTPDFVRGGYDTAFLEKNDEIISRYRKENQPGDTDEGLVEDMTMIAALVNWVMLEEGTIGTPIPQPTGTLNRWREFGKRKGMTGI